MGVIYVKFSLSSIFPASYQLGSLILCTAVLITSNPPQMNTGPARSWLDLPIELLASHPENVWFSSVPKI